MDNIKNDTLEILLSQDEIKAKVKEMAGQISEDYRGKSPVLVGILKGSVVFLAALMKEIEIRCSIDFIAVSSYAGASETSGIVKMIMDLRESITDRHVLLIEDIVDTGLTMDYLKDNLLTRRPASYNICSLLSKPSARRVPVDVKYLGFEIPDKFVVGYGLDYQEQYRNIPYIATLKPEIYRRNK